jgi:PPM family protein phosphatase
MTTTVTIGSKSDIGMKRAENQDSHGHYSPEKGCDHPKGVLIALADGMGGHAGGTKASRTAVDILMEEYYKDIQNSIPVSLSNAFKLANQAVLDAGEKDHKLKGMGSTLTAVVFHKDTLYYAHVGDSRGYRLNDGNIVQFTRDHSYVADLVKAGAITEEEAKNHPEKNIITRAIGAGPKLKTDIDRLPEKLKKGEYILLCCDGLHGLVPDHEILETVTAVQEPDAACAKLVDMANANGGLDNISVLIAKIDKTGLISKLFG